AVLGLSFTPAALAAVSGLAEDDLEPRLRSLVRRELLRRDVDHRSPERGQYAFVQALIREVAYNTLARKDRKVRHLAAARYFERLGSEELAGALAGHYLAAQENAVEGAEADALAAQARIALKAAAERAASLGSHDQAITFLQQALMVTTDPAEQADVLERAGESARAAAEYDRADSLLRRAVEIHAQVGDRAGAARAIGRLGWALLNAHRNQVALTLLESAVADYADLWPAPAVVDLKVVLARAYEQTEQHEDALRLGDEALAAAERGNLLPTLARALVGKGAALGSLGRLYEGISLIRAGEQLARDTGLNDTLAGALLVGGFHLGEIDQMAALEKYREGLALARRTGQRDLMYVFINNVGYTGFLAGDWDAALAELDAALAEDLQPSGRLWLLGNAITIRAARGEAVADGLAELEHLFTISGEPEDEIALLDARANAVLARGELDAARRDWLRIAELSTSTTPSAVYQAARPALWLRDVSAVRRDLEAIDATGFHGRVVEVRRMTVRAGLAALEGRAAEALSLYHEALGVWRELRLVWDEALTGIDMATVLQPGGPEVESTTESTRAILLRLRATPFLERLDAAWRQRIATEAPAAASTSVARLPARPAR
ncbi:MAG: hypothetical protein M3253_00555, partial [Chloroflexota bacterium]|nr:hypothetical protein [Chloroflexota bacterium]